MANLRAIAIVCFAAGMAGGSYAAQHEHLQQHLDPGAPAADCSVDRAAAQGEAETAHQGHPAKLDEHAAFLQLVPSCLATHFAVKSGAWTDPETWRDGKVPGTEARVVVPSTIS